MRQGANALVAGGALVVFVLALAAGPGCQRPTRIARRPGPELVDAGGGAVDELVRRAQHDAVRDGRQLVVYVSATWCQPCERFQKALRAGELNPYFPSLRLLKFDQDQDVGRLRVAGYDGQYIPRFVVPGPDGRGTARRIEGGTKAEDTVATSIGPRLQQLLNGGPLN
jgi:thiol-disulfide isomerase/thioredoxin